MPPLLVVGPVINKSSADRIEAWIAEPQKAGAEVCTGGGREGSVVEPTVLVGTRPGMKVEDEEIFRPVLTVSKFENFDQAVRQANAPRCGLRGGLFTRDLRRAFHAIEDWDVGGLMVNHVPIFRLDNIPAWRMEEVRHRARRHHLRHA